MLSLVQAFLTGGSETVYPVVPKEGEVWVQFFKDGFFGYGEKGDFQYWSFAHFLPIILLIGAIVAVYFFRDKIRDWKYEKEFRFIFSAVMLLVEMSYFWRLLWVGSSSPFETSLMDKLPLQVCEWTCIIMSFAMMKKSKNLYQICFYTCLTVGLFPLITPAVITTTGPAYYRYYQYWLEHIMPIFAVFYMTFVHKFRPMKRGIGYALGFLGVLATFCMIANVVFEGWDCGVNYMYLAANTDGDSIANILPENIWVRLAVFAAVAVALFVGIYFLTLLIDTKSGSRQMSKKKVAVTEGAQENAPIEQNENIEATENEAPKEENTQSEPAEK